MNNLVLLTGATGFLGPHVLNLLIENGYYVRVVGPDYVKSTERITWLDINFLNEVNYDALVDNVTIVVHLAAELYSKNKMEQVNVDASRRLAIASEKKGVQLFVYTSSVGVYGFPAQREINELTPTLSLEGKDKKNFMAEDFLYEYSLSKLKGESAIRDALKNTQGIIFRPSNMVDKRKIIEVLDYGLIKRIWRGSRKTHHIYVKDVAEAILFAIEKFKEKDHGVKGIQIYNLTNDIGEGKTYKDLFDLYVRITGDKSKKCPITLPIFFDFIKDVVKFKNFSGSLPAGSVSYSPEKLLNSGYKYRYGIKKFYEDLFLEYLK